MADEKPTTVEKEFTNSGSGPRSLILASGETLIVRPGEGTGKREFREADLEGISPDLVEGPPQGGGAGGTTERTSGVDLNADLATLDKNQLLALGAEMGLSMLGDDASDDDLRDAIQKARDEGAGTIEADARELENSNSRAKLIEIAKEEGVTFETDDNKGDLSLKIAQHRANASA